MELLDQFFDQVVRDINSNLDTDLRYVCFDAGAIDSSVLEGEYDFEKLRENIVPFEFQMPFSAMYYFFAKRKLIRTYLRFQHMVLNENREALEELFGEKRF